MKVEKRKPYIYFLQAWMVLHLGVYRWTVWWKSKERLGKSVCYVTAYNCSGFWKRVRNAPHKIIPNILFFRDASLTLLGSTSLIKCREIFDCLSKCELLKKILHNGFLAIITGLNVWSYFGNPEQHLKIWNPKFAEVMFKNIPITPELQTLQRNWPVPLDE